jgi:hypothetical protein
MAINPNTNFTVGQVATSDQMNRFPRGVMGKAVRTSGNLTIGPGIADITDMSITFTAVAGRIYRATWSVNALKNTAAGWTEAFFTDSANVIYGASIGYTIAAQWVNLSGVSEISGLTAGSKTFKLRLEPENNTSLVVANANLPCQLIIEDIGAA